MTGKELKQLRESAGLNQVELAALVGVHPTSINNWEGSARLRKPAELAIRSVLEKQGKARRTA